VCPGLFEFAKDPWENQQRSYLKNNYDDLHYQHTSVNGAVRKDYREPENKLPEWWINGKRFF
jgi:hypothetical protein